DGDDPPLRQPEGDELARRWVASEDDLVPARGVAGVLHAEVVLIGEEVRQTFVGSGEPEHVAGRYFTLMEGVGPVLHPDAGLVEGVPGGGDIAGGEDTRHARLEAFVRRDAVVHEEAGA